MASLINRHGTFYLQWYAGKRIRRQSLRTESLQVAKDKLRQFESAQLRGLDNPPPIAQVTAAYVQHMRVIKTAKSAQTDIYYLREAFGSVCDELKITSRKVSEAARKRALIADAKRERRSNIIEASCFEQIPPPRSLTSSPRRSAVAAWLPRPPIVIARCCTGSSTGRWISTASRSPATTIRFGVLSGTKNERRRFDSRLQQIDEQMHALRFNPRLQTIVAMYIYAGLRREEALCLTLDDMDLTGGTAGMA